MLLSFPNIKFDSMPEQKLRYQQVNRCVDICSGPKNRARSHGINLLQPFSLDSSELYFQWRYSSQMFSSATYPPPQNLTKMFVWCGWGYSRRHHWMFLETPDTNSLFEGSPDFVTTSNFRFSVFFLPFWDHVRRWSDKYRSHLGQYFHKSLKTTNDCHPTP